MREEFDTGSSHEMATAHIMIKCKSDSLKEVLEHLKSIEGVVEVLEIVGEYDILAKVEAESSESLKRIIKWKISDNNEKILSVTTLLCMRKPLCITVK